MEKSLVYSVVPSILMTTGNAIVVLIDSFGTWLALCHRVYTRYGEQVEYSLLAECRIARHLSHVFYHINCIDCLLPISSVTKNMARETILITLLTAFVLVYNGCITGFQDLSGTFHDPILSSPWLPPLTLPLQVFTLTSPSLSFLLGTYEWEMNYA
jgi:hypothetical protein